MSDKVLSIVEDDEIPLISMAETAKQYCKSADLGLPFTDVEVVDIIEFCESPDWGNLKLYPAQSLFFKIAYKLWEKYPFTEDELALVELEKHRWGIDLLSRCHNEPLNHFMFITGRRGLKSSTISFLMSYEAYRLISLGCPQKHYGIVEDEEIYITNCASSEDQAKTIFNMANDRIKSIKFFNKYIDPGLDSSTELALFTPADLEKIAQIEKENATIPRGKAYLKQNIPHGSIRLKSIPTSARTARSRGSIVTVLDEFAHFPRAKAIKQGQADPRDLVGANHTDIAVYRALEPAAATFGKDFKIFIISSPLDQSGHCFYLYNLWKDSSTKYVQQFATWEVNPNITRDGDLVAESFESDPLSARMEWGAEFVKSANPLFSESIVESLVNPARVYNTSYVTKGHYIITLDPAKGSDPDSDTYAVAWGHIETYQDGSVKYIVDGMKGFRPESVFDAASGVSMINPIDPSVVDEFVLNLAKSLRVIVGVFFDQYESTRAISLYRRYRLPAAETVFTSQYKREMYSNLIEACNKGLVEVYGNPGPNGEGDWELEMLKLELLYLQKVVSGNNISYKHPDSGPVVTDDFADAVANLIHQLIRYKELGSTYMQDLVKKATGPISIGSTVKPILGSGVHIPINKLHRTQAQRVHESLRSRIGGRRG